jgi:uncharacterized protein with GYD domain
MRTFLRCLKALGQCCHFTTTARNRERLMGATADLAVTHVLYCRVKYTYDQLCNCISRMKGGFAMMFIMSLNWTDQGIRSVKEAPRRAQAARDLAKKVGVEIKNIYLTSGESDLVAILETSNGDNAAKFAMALGTMGNVRSKTARAWSEPEFQKLIAELP